LSGANTSRFRRLQAVRQDYQAVRLFYKPCGGIISCVAGSQAVWRNYESGGRIPSRTTGLQAVDGDYSVHRRNKRLARLSRMLGVLRFAPIHPRHPGPYFGDSTFPFPVQRQLSPANRLKIALPFSDWPVVVLGRAPSI